MRATKSTLALFLATVGCAYGQSNTITVEIGTRSGSTDPVKTAVTARAKKIAAITDAAKRRLMAKYPGRQISFPTRVNVTRNGLRVTTRSGRQKSC